MKRFIIGFVIMLVLVGFIIPMTIASAQETGPLDNVVILPINPIIPVSTNQTFTAIGKDASGHTVDNVSFNWSVVAGGGSINATSGVFTANATPGIFANTILVTAVKGDITRTANTSVTIGVQGLLDHVIISPLNPTIRVSTNQTFTAIGKDAFNQTVSDVSFSWSVVAGGRSINATSGVFTAGDVTGKFANTILVTAVKGDITTTANASVTITSKSSEKGKKSDEPKGWSKGNKNGWDDKETPPGWSKGNKKGWQGEKMPPGRSNVEKNDKNDKDDAGNEDEVDDED